MRPGTRILLVEDDHAITSSVELELDRRNVMVRCANDAQEALWQIEKFRPELIVLDIMLPKLDGVGVLNSIRAEGNRVPVIMLTARELEVDGGQAGVPEVKLGATRRSNSPGRGLRGGTRPVRAGTLRVG